MAPFTEEDDFVWFFINFFFEFRTFSEVMSGVMYVVTAVV